MAVVPLRTSSSHGAPGSLDRVVERDQVAVGVQRVDRADQVAGRVVDPLGEERLVEVRVGLGERGQQQSLRRGRARRPRRSRRCESTRSIVSPDQRHPERRTSACTPSGRSVSARWTMACADDTGGASPVPPRSGCLYARDGAPRPPARCDHRRRAITIVGTFLPWLRSGDNDRNSFQLLSLLDFLGFAPAGPLGWAVRAWPTILLVCVRVGGDGVAWDVADRRPVRYHRWRLRRRSGMRRSASAAPRHSSSALGHLVTIVGGVLLVVASLAHAGAGMRVFERHAACTRRGRAWRSAVNRSDAGRRARRRRRRRARARRCRPPGRLRGRLDPPLPRPVRAVVRPGTTAEVAAVLPVLRRQGSPSCPRAATPVSSAGGAAARRRHGRAVHAPAVDDRAARRGRRSDHGRCRGHARRRRGGRRRSRLARRRRPRRAGVGDDRRDGRRRTPAAPGAAPRDDAPQRRRHRSRARRRPVVSHLRGAASRTTPGTTSRRCCAAARARWR